MKMWQRQPILIKNSERRSDNLFFGHICKIRKVEHHARLRGHPSVLFERLLRLVPLSLAWWLQKRRFAPIL